VFCKSPPLADSLAPVLHSRYLCPAGVTPSDPADVVAARLDNVTFEDVPTLQAAHNAWWASYWSRSAISLDAAHSDTEAFWWSAVYALGSATRAGQVCTTS
jgi:hypothetical protein